jgi:TolA-binding protein
VKRRALLVSAFVVLALAAAALPSPVLALEEADRLYLVGERAVADGLNALAARALERFVTDYPNDGRIPLATILLGRAWLGVGLHERALETFRKAQTVAPPPGPASEARLWEAEALFRLKRYAEARTAFEEVFRNDPTSPLAADAVYGLGWTEMENKRYEAALKYFRELIASWPQHALVPSASVYAARSLIELKRYPDIHMLLIDFPTKYPNHPLRPDAQYFLALARLRGGDAKGGRADLQAFVEANPKHEYAATARRMMGESVTRVGDRDELQATYQARMTESPASPEGLDEAASIAERLGRPKEQEAAWRKLRKEFPEHALGRRAALELARAAFKRKEWKEAATFGRVAAPTDEEAVRSEALLLVGEAELKQKRFPDAVKAFEGVAAVDGVDAAVRYRALAGLGLAHEEQQNLKPALSAYEAVAGKSPDPALREWAQERVKAVKARLAKAPPPAAKTPPPAAKPADKPKGKS